MSKILVIGDVIEDLIVVPETAIRKNTDTNAKITKSMGGQAANVASWLSYLGTETSFVGCVGIEDVSILTASLKQHGIKPQLQTSSKQTGSLVVLVDGQERSMLTDRGANTDLDFSVVDPTGHSVVYLSGYSLLNRNLKDLQRFADRIHDAGGVLAIDPGSYGFIKDHGVESFKSLVQLADLVFPNHEEENLLGLSGNVPLTVITNGAGGAKAVWADGNFIEVKAVVEKLIDPTGAGDAFCAGFLSRLVAVSNYRKLEPETVQLALETAVTTGSRAVSLVGARPSINS